MSFHRHKEINDLQRGAVAVFRVEWDLLKDPAGQYSTSARSQSIQQLKQQGGFAVNGHLWTGLLRSSEKTIGIVVIGCADEFPW